MGQGEAGPVRVGLRLPRDITLGADMRDAVARAQGMGIDHLCVGDHVSFRGGKGVDGLVVSGALAAMSDDVAVWTTVYLLPLRHPLPVARSLQTLDAIAPGRFVFGVGVGGEDPHEVEICGVDPRTRGRRTDESLDILRGLLAGETVSHDGEFFSVRDAEIRPRPSQPIPFLVGGRSAAALRRTARFADGWLALWLSPRRFEEATAQVEQLAAEAGRLAVAWRHALYLWAGFGRSRESARDPLARAMEDFYATPFEKFEKWTPFGTPEQVAEVLSTYVAAGCREFCVNGVAEDGVDILESTAEVRRLLRP